jgi:bacillithiol system protein YtxJ
VVWRIITSESDLDDLKQRSKNTPQVIFKHSTRCSISSLAKNRLERENPASSIEFNFLDLLQYRNISNKIESDFSVCHESPQVLLIKDGKCIYDESHNGISMTEIEEAAFN